ncbi:amino acid ABC transporter substrate-binding protein [Fuscibacter oryzae]|uniref:Amino acid ABC transporter substrate-binding protein n=1 Tax=Fuscibacter oryzae TaxID=2803939 RepID=A0A8J7SWY3_9RHOB|nr:amino acid ABC transporter substrate-binding protein [Fuscibacter oryzae]MBL4930166.1 amino acid ABC transporter substrate-binding protein [Fuscibacter oryzae]
MTIWIKGAITAGVVALSSVAAHAEAGDTLKAVQARGTLNCPGSIGSYLGFAEVDDKGNWKGLDIDLCRAVATAVFGDPEKVKIVPIDWAQRWPSLQSGDIDIVIKASGGTLSRDTELGLQFSNSYYLGTTKVMAHKELGLTGLKEADGGSICVPAGTSTEQQVTSYLQRLGIKMEVVAIDKTEEIEKAFFSGRCDTYAQWGPVLAIAASQQKDPSAYVLLPDVLATEPEVMIVRQGDDNWLDVANWTLSVMLFAEQEGITSQNVDEMKANPPSTEIGKMLGATPGIGKGLGLSDDWAYNVIKKVGNYSEVFERGLGQGSPYKMPRDLTALWNAGGVLYPFVID